MCFHWILIASRSVLIQMYVARLGFSHFRMCFIAFESIQPEAFAIILGVSMDLKKDPPMPGLQS